MGLQKFLPLTQSLLVFGARNCVDLSSWLWKPGLGDCCGSGTTHHRDIPPKFLYITHGCRTSLFHISDFPTSLDGCGFFNSVIVRFPFRPGTSSSQTRFTVWLHLGTSKPSISSSHLRLLCNSCWVAPGRSQVGADLDLHHLGKPRAHASSGELQTTLEHNHPALHS